MNTNRMRGQACQLYQGDTLNMVVADAADEIDKLRLLLNCTLPYLTKLADVEKKNRRPDPEFPEKSPVEYLLEEVQKALVE